MEKKTYKILEIKKSNQDQENTASEHPLDELSQVKAMLEFMKDSMEYFLSKEYPYDHPTESAQFGSQLFFRLIKEKLESIDETLSSKDKDVYSSIDHANTTFEMFKQGAFRTPKEKLKETVEELDFVITESDKFRLNAENLKKECMAYL